jgi:hypothetical protein
MPDVLLNVPWAKQEKSFFCGPAVAEMLISAAGTTRPASPPTWQERLWEDIKAQTLGSRPSDADREPSSFPSQKCERCDGDPDWHCWATTPEALKRVLNMGQAATTFAVQAHAAEGAATAQLLASIDAGHAPAALVYGWQHWIVVRGYAHGMRKSCGAAGRQFSGLYLRNSKVNNPLHFVTCRKWYDDYLRSVPCGEYSGDYVVITGTAAMPVSNPTPPPPPDGRRNRVIDPDTARREAEVAARELLELQPERWNPGFANKPARQPLLVRRLDRDNSYYYIVSFGPERRETARLIVDAHSAEFDEAIAVEREDGSLAPFIEPRRTLDPWWARLVELPALRDYRITRETVKVDDSLVWRPCDQSTTPFLPFYQVYVGDSLIYLRIDGEPFDRLTESVA